MLWSDPDDRAGWGIYRPCAGSATQGSVSFAFFICKIKIDNRDFFEWPGPSLNKHPSVNGMGCGGDCSNILIEVNATEGGGMRSDFSHSLDNPNSYFTIISKDPEI